MAKSRDHFEKRQKCIYPISISFLIKIAKVEERYPYQCARLHATLVAPMHKDTGLHVEFLRLLAV